MQYVHRPCEANGINRPVRIAFSTFDDLKDSWTLTMPNLGYGMLASLLSNAQRIPHKSANINGKQKQVTFG